MNLREAYIAWKDKRFLKKNHVSSWEEYNRVYDSDISHGSGSIKDWYHGYSHIFVFVDPSVDIWTRYGDWLQGLAVIDDWCKENVKHKYRHDIHRVIRSPWRNDEWENNEIGGYDYVFFAFKDEADFLLFSLRWS